MCATKEVASKDAPAKNVTFVSGQIKISGYLVDLFYVIDNDVFVCKPLEEPTTIGVVLEAIGKAHGASVYQLALGGSRRYRRTCVLHPVEVCGASRSPNKGAVK